MSLTENHVFVPCEGSAHCHHQRPHCQLCGGYADGHQHLCGERLSTGAATNIATCGKSPDHEEQEHEYASYTVVNGTIRTDYRITWKEVSISRENMAL